MRRLRSLKAGTLVAQTRPAPYRPNQKKLIQLFTAGFAGTLVTLVLSAAFSILGWVTTDFGALFASLITTGEIPSVTEPIWWVGLTVYLGLGIFAFPILLDLLADRRLMTNHRLFKGLLAGLGLWLLFEGVLKPAAGMGFFSSELPAPIAATALSLLLWMAYGLSFEQVSRVRIVHELRLVEDRAA
jgi:hypothetical protein